MSDPILPPHSTPSTLQLPEFEILGILGSGTFGTVWKVRWHRAGFATPPIVALKRIRMDPCKKYQEAELVKGLDHPNIVKRAYSSPQTCTQAIRAKKFDPWSFAHY